MKIYTRGGDGGETSLFGGARVGKGHVRVEALGAVDELNATIGWAATPLTDPPTREGLEAVQHDLFAIGAELAPPPAREGRARPATPGMASGRTAELEAWIDEVVAEVPELRAFVIPGGSPAGAALHLARTVCRRAERAVVRLTELDDVDDAVMAYLNRLSDLLFTLARRENHRQGAGDIEWVKP